MFKLLCFLLLSTSCFAQIIKLPPPEKSPFSLFEALKKQRSVRSYKKGGIKLSQLSLLLFACYGGGATAATRTVPSAGAIYPLSIYVVCAKGGVEGLKEGVYFYEPGTHSLRMVKEKDVQFALSLCCYGQRWVREAPINIVICADYKRMERFYGKRAKRYVHMEVGHIGQNIHLCSTALGLGTVAIGAFLDTGVKKLLGIKESPLYIMPVGKKK
jgi:SagB-type dehydrogenase family enzyme